MDEIYKITIGALLHDIGKVVQRAQDHPFDKKHGQWGYDWLNDLAIFDNQQIINATITHHRNDDGVFNSNLGLIWYEADNLASSERKMEQEDHKKWDLYTPLVSPFFNIRNPNNLQERLSSLPYIPLAPLNNGPYFVQNDKPKITKEDYKKLLSSLENDFKKAKNYGLSVNVVLMILEKYLSTVPSITAEVFEKGGEDIYKHPDISLYDHLKLTAAISVCLYHYFSDRYKTKWGEKVLKEEILNSQEDIFMLIGGDISGIQKFIYTIASKGALKSLKGRSFYLELLVEHIISKLLQELELPRTNIIFAGGGHFYILAYNTDKAINAINKVKKNMDDYLFDEFKGALQVQFAYTPFNKEGFKRADNIWDDLSNKLEECKKRKWSDRIFEVLKVEGQSKDCETDYCEVCFREDLPLEDLQRHDTVLKVCLPCKIQYSLGSTLSRIKTDVPYESKFIYKCRTDNNEEAIKIGEYYYILKNNLDLKIDAEEVIVINNFSLKNYEHPNSFYLPLGIYHNESIEELSDAIKEFGMERIAVLRMDVDNLGKIFSQAVPEESRTFSRMASISRNLNYFFKVYINYILAGKCKGSIDLADRNWQSNKGRMLSVVYSGGDDVFLIGHWLDIIEAAYDIYNFFKKFTGNEFITISGGIAINNENYPVYQFANDADRFEKCAKGGGKNAIAFFDDEKAVRWDSFPKIIERVELFKAFLKKQEKYFTSHGESLPTTFFYRLLALARRFKEDKVLILPKCAYLLARLKKGPEDKILKLKEVIMNSNEEEWDITEKSTQLILMMMRKGGRENG